MKRTILCLLLLACLSGRAVLAQGGGLVVDAAEAQGPISPLVYGANYSAISIVGPDLYDEVAASGLTFLRFPGGRWGDRNNMQPFHIDLLMIVADLLNAEPGIHVRLENGTPEAAAALVRYTNLEKGYGVRYWMIGNEPNLFDDYTTEDLNREWRAIAEAMLAVDPDIILMGPDISQYTGEPSVDPRDPEGRDWLREFLRANGDLVDIVSVHRYPFPRSQAHPVTTIDDLRANTRQWDLIPARLRATIREITGRDLPIAFTEVNSHWSAAIGGEASPDSLYNAIWWADVLGRLIREGVFIVAYFDLYSPSGGRGGWGLLDRYNPRPTYYVYQLYQRFGDELVLASSDDPDVSIYAALGDDGALTLMVVNLGPEAQTKPLRLDHFTPGGPAERWLLDADHLAEQLDDLDIASDGAITVPGQSVSLFIVPAG